MSRINLVTRFLLCWCLVGRSLASDPWVIRFEGVGPVKIGMSLSQLNLALHEKFLMPANKDDRACFIVNPKAHPHISFMVEDGRLSRIDVDSSGIRSSEGIQVGDSEARALQTYGSRMKVKAHQYTDGHYLTAQSEDGHYGVRYETDNGKITTFYAGRYESIQYVEGCE